MSENSGGYPPSWYAATRLAGPSVARLEGDRDAEICIVGGGYTGLSAALHLARASRSVVLVEAERLGWGASGRNGGQIHVGMRREQEWLEQALGEVEARAFWRIALDARVHLDWLIGHYRIACDLTPGYLHADHRRRFTADTRAHVDHLRDRYGYEHVRFVDRDEVRHLVGSDAYHGGMVDARGGHLHALNFALGIAAAAATEGALLFDRTPATAIVRHGARWRVTTPHGSITADRVLVACNGYSRGLVPAVERHVMPINNYIAVTGPLGESGVQALIREGHAVSDSRFVVYYFRITRDHRLLFGGGENYSWTFPSDIAGFVRPHMLRIFPQLKRTRIEHAWGGTLAITPNRMPFVREIEPGLTAIAGFSGLGVVLAPYLGKLAAQALGGEAGMLADDFRRLARLDIPRFPGGRLMRWPTLVAAMSALSFRDAF
ncbi:MAG: FAD-binding oxidoreductase [Sphingomonadaceae bacterium]|nr:FAD-binding oxidoreductase [Sphingomonadaceae bacterium]